MKPRVYAKTSDVVNSDLWRLFPVINVDKVKDIPRDYPGAMGVPITIFDKLNREQFEVFDLARPKIRGRQLYRRVIIRHLKPDLPEVIDLTEWLDKTGAKWEFVLPDEGDDSTPNPSLSEKGGETKEEMRG